MNDEMREKVEFGEKLGLMMLEGTFGTLFTAVSNSWAIELTQMEEHDPVVFTELFYKRKALNEIVRYASTFVSLAKEERAKADPNYEAPKPHIV